MSIAIKKTKNIVKGLSEIFEELNFKPGKRVYIKPNLCGREPVLPGENTSIEVLDALINVLQSFNCKIIIGHGALLGSIDHQTSFEKILKISGYEKYKNVEGIKLLNLDILEREEKKIEEMIFHLPIKFLEEEIDTYINLAKIKTHMEATVSFSLKNQMGFPSQIDRVMMHKTDLEKTIAKLARIIKPDLSILEGFPAMENNGPHHGTPKNINLLVASRDMVELDSFVSEILGYNSREIKHIQYAADFGVGKYFCQSDLSKYKKYLVNNFKKADKIYKFGLRLFAYPTYSCSRCINAVNLTGKEFKKHPLKYWRIILKALFSKKKINIIFGRADNLKLNNKDKFICVGNCAKKFSERYGVDCLDKCPPSIEETKDYIIKNILK